MKVDDVKAYIESGILELYVLGDLSPEERRAVEDMATRYDAVRTELQHIEKALEQYADENAVTPSDDLRDRILNSLVTNLGDDRIFRSTPRQIAESAAIEKPVRSLSFYKYAFAACLALLAVSLAALLSVYNQLKESRVQLVALQSQNQRFSTRVNLLNSEVQVFRDPSFKFIQLTGTARTPASKLTVAWNPIKKKVMIDMRSMNLPATDAKHQYQLWAIVNNKPVDLGVFDATTDSTDMKLMKPVAQPQAFAVTMEPRGGSVFPTLDQMVVQSKI